MPIALKVNVTRGQISSNNILQDESDEDEEINLIDKNFRRLIRKGVKKRGKFDICKEKTKGGESSRRERGCYNCGNKNHFIGDCLKPRRNKAFIGGAWSNSEDGNKPQNEETCLMAIDSKRTSPLVDNDMIEEHAVQNHDRTPNPNCDLDEVLPRVENNKEIRDHLIDQVIRELDERTLRFLFIPDTAITKTGTKLLHRAYFSCSWDTLGISTLKEVVVRGGGGGGGAGDGKYGLERFSRGVIGDSDRVISNEGMLWRGVGEEEVVVGDGVERFSLSLVRSTNSCFGEIIARPRWDSGQLHKNSGGHSRRIRDL
ncbi:putative reverse transcriptase domain-containing protein [Tanacetum coccineum]